MSGGASSSSNVERVEKDKESLWYFTAEQLANSPSRRHNINADMELSYRQMTAYLIQEMGQRLQISQLCINTAIVYMHRFYAFHSFTHFHRQSIAAASIFLAAKVEEQPRKLEHVIKVANKCRSQPTPSTTDAYYIEQAQELVFNENVLLQTLGFDVAIDHPHTHVIKTCHLVKACKDLAKTSYFLASNSLHLTSMCLQYKPTVIACFCIYLACKWSRWEIPQSTEGKHWFHYVDRTVTMDLLKQLTDEFIAIYEKSPSRLKSKLNSIKALAQGASNRAVSMDKKQPAEEWKMVDMMKMYHSPIDTPSVTNNQSSATQSALAFAPQTSAVASEQQQTQNVTPALLPPPPPQPQSQQQLRKGELHSSQQQRSHHNSGSHHHHGKLVFPSGDVTDHKTGHKQQQPFGGNGNAALNVNRPPREHSQTSQGGTHQSLLPPSSATSSSRSTNPTSSSSNVGRSASGVLSNSSISGQRQTSAQGHQLDVNYHKSTRDRINLPPTTLGVPPHAGGGHKLLQKQESSGRGLISKDSSALKQPPSDQQQQQSKQGNNKMYPPTTTTTSSAALGAPAAYGTKIDAMGHDMSRGMVHGQRGYSLNNGPQLGYHQTGQQLSRQSGSGASGSNIKPSSVQIQAQQQQLPHHKQLLPPEAHSSLAYGDQSNTQLSSMAPHSLTSQSQVKASLFSPSEWNEKMQPPPSQLPYNSNLQQQQTSSIAPGDAYMKVPATSLKDSPQGRVDRERLPDAVAKKEKNRSSFEQQTQRAMFQQQQQMQQQLKSGMQKKSDLNELGGNLKRSNESASFKQEEDMMRESKLRKMERESTSALPAPSYQDTKPQLVNGIETNPDLVSSLLKESLCTTNALLKTEQLTAPSLQPPAELLDPSSYKGNGASSSSAVASDVTAMEVGGEEVSGGKSEKKKKKDKHKHKEKDKSKDREERKKHKREKERHKDRERAESDNSEHVKIKISKEKLDGASGSGGFKIKIPKDRLSSDLNSTSTSSSQGGVERLKIKISKEKVYSSEASDPISMGGLQAASSASQLQPSVAFHSSIVPAGTSSHGSSSSKKKDRDRDKDREREREKKRNAHDSTKSNGSASGGAGGTSGSLLPAHMLNTTTSTSKSQNSSKMPQQQHMSNMNMNQLFGESNDDDDDDEDDIRGAAYNRHYQELITKTSSSSLPATASSAATASSSQPAISRQNSSDYGSRNTQSQPLPTSHFSQHSAQHHTQQQR